MLTDKNNPEPKLILPKYLNYYYRLNKSDKAHWFDFDEVNKNNDATLMKYMKEISLVKLLYARNIIMQKKETRNGYSIRIAIPKKSEERYVGYFKDSIECSLILIRHSREPYFELFLSETVKNNALILLQMLEDRELEDEIKYYRTQASNGSIIKAD
ncbi:MAG: hypothetical protein ABIN01_09145 [Ferruginibacter sp.]